MGKATDMTGLQFVAQYKKGVCMGAERNAIRRPINSG
jgi:hypothetical protein